MTHTFAPVYDNNSKILILGSFPSVKSREQGFYYGHPRNRFWQVMSSILHVPLPDSVEEKKHLLLSNHIALWDVVASCDITGSSDSSIRNVVPADLSLLMKNTNISSVYANGGTAARLYEIYGEIQTAIKSKKLPSTSPANAAWSLERLVAVWSVILTELDG